MILCGVTELKGNLEKQIIKLGFKLYNQTFIRDNKVGYIYDGKNKVIAVTSEDYLEKFEYNYYLAKALTYYKYAIITDEYYQDIEMGYKSVIDDITINMLLSDNRFLHCYKKCNGDLEKISEMLKLPINAIKEKDKILFKKK